jgi:hypothetical protein
MIDLGERFWSKTRIVDGPMSTPCRVWTGGTVTNRRGERYGKVWWNGKCELAHRVAAAARAGVELASVETANHACDNPLCVEHSIAGTQSENVQDMYAKGRR